jgi:hypothetical protein
MLRLSRFLVLPAILLLTNALPAHGLGLGGFGLRVGMDLAQKEVNYVSGSQFDSARLVLGGHVDLGSIFTSKLHLVPGLDVVMEDDLRIYSINTETRYYFTKGEKASGYAGGGIGVHLYRFGSGIVTTTGNSPDDTKFSLNIPVGFQRNIGQGLEWFGELKLVIADDEIDSSFRFTLGVLMDLGL